MNFFPFEFGVHRIICACWTFKLVFFFRIKWTTIRTIKKSREKKVSLVTSLHRHANRLAVYCWETSSVCDCVVQFHLFIFNSFNMVKGVDDVVASILCNFWKKHQHSTEHAINIVCSTLSSSIQNSNSPFKLISIISIYVIYITIVPLCTEYKVYFLSIHL